MSSRMHLQDRTVLTVTRPSAQPRITRILGFFDSTTKVLLAVGGLIAASIALWAALTSLVSSGSATGTHAPSSPPAIHATAGNSASTNGNGNTTNINGSGNSASTNGTGNTTNARGSGNSASTHGNGNITNINGSDNTSTIGGS